MHTNDNCPPALRGLTAADQAFLDDYFGVCPHCEKTDGYVNAGSTHVFYCDEHKVSWIAGANLFSGWRDETEEEQRKKYKHIETHKRDPHLWVTVLAVILYFAIVTIVVLIR